MMATSDLRAIVAAIVYAGLSQDPQGRAVLHRRYTPTRGPHVEDPPRRAVELADGLIAAAAAGRTGDGRVPPDPTASVTSLTQERLAVRDVVEPLVGPVPLGEVVQYYECHITVEPVFGDRLTELEALARVRDFRLADLLMLKDRQPTTERSDRDAFLTGRGDYAELSLRMVNLSQELADAGFTVWRRKIEAILYDSSLPGDRR